MADLTRPDRGEAMERLLAKVQSLSGEDQGAYMLLALSVLGHNAPDVLTFLLDQADRVLADEVPA